MNLKPEGEDTKAEASGQDACTVCYTNQKKIVYNCGHFMACFKCNIKIIDDDSKCPMCRKLIT